MKNTFAKESFLPLGLASTWAGALSAAIDFIVAPVYVGARKKKLQAIACSLLTAAQILTPSATFAADPSCAGNGCDSLTFYWESGCHKIRNIGSRPVKFTWGLFSGRVKPTEAVSMMNPFGGCVQGIVGSRAAFLD